VNGGPLDTLWREAVENRRVAAAEAGPLPLAKEISRMVAIPVEVKNEIAGVLLAGLPRRRATLETLDRLQWRAAMAAEVLEREQRMHAEVQAQDVQKKLRESGKEAIPVDCQGVKETGEALQQAIEWLEEGLVVFDESDRILARNTMFLKLLGLSEAEGKRLTNLTEAIEAASKNAADPKLFAASWRTLEGLGWDWRLSMDLCGRTAERFRFFRHRMEGRYLLWNFPRRKSRCERRRRKNAGTMGAARACPQQLERIRAIFFQAQKSRRAFWL
jgi:PAS domain-containing protein